MNKDTDMILTIKKAVKRYQLYAVVIIIYSLFSILTPPKAEAAKQTLRVSPVIMNLSLSPGKTLEQEVTIENLTTTPLPLRASLTDFVTGGEEGGYVFENTKTNPLLKWITLSDDTFILAPNEKKTLTMTVQMPKSIPVGGYYGLLFFEPVLQGITNPQTQVSTKVGVLLLGNLGVPSNGKRADILTFNPVQLSQDGTVPFLLRVQNISLNFFTAKPILKITPVLPLGNANTPIYLEEKLIFPDNIRRWTEDEAVTNLSPNLYKMQLAVSTGNGEQEFTERYVIVFPWMKALLGFAGVLLLIFLVVKRTRLKKAVHELFKS